ncbi:hypothetical protein ACIQGZ_12190 [Streptomyces sp. NPDC092296]|uniref:hypothetical protein n=1 Tax=Streptomyces sp. NPDC092296 TaxID=3366012 RepID=UPI0038075D72
MTASAQGRRPARQALRPARSERTRWSVLLVMLLFLVPGGVGAAHAVGAGHHGGARLPAVAHPAARAHPATYAATYAAARASTAEERSGPAARQSDGGLPALCSVYDNGGRPGSGCAPNHPCVQDALLPNAPPQPLVAPLPALVVLRPAPAAEPQGPLPDSHRPPDLHQLQVHRT